MTRIADTIGHKMKLKGMTVVGLSTQTGIPRTTLQRRFKFPDTLTFGELDLIAGALDMGAGLDLLNEVTKASGEVA